MLQTNLVQATADSSVKIGSLELIYSNGIVKINCSQLRTMKHSSVTRHENVLVHNIGNWRTGDLFFRRIDGSGVPRKILTP